MARSRAATFWLTANWVIYSASAAAEKEPQAAMLSSTWSRRT